MPHDDDYLRPFKYLYQYAPLPVPTRLDSTLVVVDAVFVIE